MKSRFFTLTTLTQKLCVYIGAATGAVLLVTIVLNYENRRKSVEAESNAVALDHIQNTAQSIDAYIDRVAMLPRSIAARQEALQGEPNATTMPFLSRIFSMESRRKRLTVFMRPSSVRATPTRSRSPGSTGKAFPTACV